jgi:hypothetical protein
MLGKQFSSRNDLPKSFLVEWGMLARFIEIKATGGVSPARPAGGT